MKKLFFALALSALLPGAALAQSHIAVNGSTTMLPIMHKIVESYATLRGDVTVALSGGGSGNGIKALIDGYADIAMSSRELRENEIKLAAGKNVRIVARPLAIDALCPIVNPANPVSGLSLAQLRGIFSGRITNWREVGGEDKPLGHPRGLAGVGHGRRGGFSRGGHAGFERGRAPGRGPFQPGHRL